MQKPADLKAQLSKLKEKFESDEDFKSLVEESLALAETAIDAFENSEREIKILTGC